MRPLPLGRTVVGAICLMVLAATPAGSRAQDPAEPESVDPELEDALQELDEAGAPLSASELRELLGTGESAPASRTDSRRPGRLDLGLVTEPGAAEGPDPRLRIDARWGGWRVGGRIRDRVEEPSVRGALQFEGERQRIRAGNVGLAWGAGLLSAGPGRSAGLSAGERLARFRSGPVSGGSYGDPRALRGVAAGLSLGRWRSWGAYGSTEPGSAQPGPMRQVGGFGVAGSSANLGLLAVREQKELGFGLQAGIERSRWQAAVEAAGSKPPQADYPWRAVLVRGAWSLGRKCSVEGAFAAANGSAWFGAGRRPALLVEDEGRGWALRGAAEPVPGWRLAAILARAVGSDPQRDASRRRRDRTGIEVRWNPAKGWSIQLRWRRTLEQEWTGSERYPWLPAVAGAEKRRMIWTAVLRRRAGPVGWKVTLRTQSDGNGLEIRHRNLLQGTGSIEPRSWIRLQASWATAWGGDADLVSALTPMPGVLLPRHWGHWRSETALGIRLRHAAVNCNAAVSQRVPEPEPATRTTTERNVWAGLCLRF